MPKGSMMFQAAVSQLADMGRDISIDPGSVAANKNGTCDNIERRP
jgi:hypothetical protein